MNHREVLGSELFRLRSASGKTARDVADKLGWTFLYVRLIECGDEVEFCAKRLEDYLVAIGCRDELMRLIRLSNDAVATSRFDASMAIAPGGRSAARDASIEDLEKARWHLDREIQRLKSH